MVRGTISGSSITFDGAISAFDLSDATSQYTKPAVSLDGSGYVWTAAIKDLGVSAGDRFKVVATRTLTTVTSPLQCNGEQAVSRSLLAAKSISLVPLNNNDMLLALTGEGYSNNIVTYRFNGATWSEVTSGGEFGWSISAGTANLDVNAIARGPNGELYVGGYFSSAGFTTASNVAMWNGTSWSALGTGVTGTSNYGRIQALAVDSLGNLYAGGWFTTAGGASANYVAKWNGTAWSPLGSGMNSVVNALAVDSNDTLYAGGSFTTANGAAAQYIAKWNGTAWSALGSGVSGAVRALAINSAGHLYVGGDFTTAGGIGSNYVARWTGTAWGNLGGGGYWGTNSSVYSLAFDSNGALYAGGNFTTAGGVSARRVAKWNGSSWSAFGGGTDGLVTSLTIDNSGDLYIGGAFTDAGGIPAAKVAKWNGSVWSALGAGVSATPSVIAVDADGALFVGASDDTSNANLLSWDGVSWQDVVNGFNGAVRQVVIDSLGRVYAAGNFTRIGNVLANRIAMWDGTSWSPLGSGMTSTSGTTTVAGLALDTAGNLYASGTFTHAGGTSANNIAMWNGSSWSALGSGTSYHVSAIALDTQGNLYAGGSFSTAGGISASRVAKWNGTDWSALGAGTSGGMLNSVYAVAVAPNGNVYVGGSFASAGGVAANNIAKWDGSAWSALGTGCDGYVRGLTATPNGSLYAIGTFLNAGGIPVNRIAMWDGTAWSALGSGLNSAGLTSSLIVSTDGTLYAGGAFTTAGGISANRVAAWDGTSWRAVGSGVPHAVYDIAMDPSGAIYAGTSRSLAYGRLVTAADAGASVVSSLIPGANGTAHLLYTDSERDLRIKTLSGSSPTWSASSIVHTGTVTSVAATFYAPTEKIVSWFIEGNEVLSGEASSPYTSWSPTTSISTTGNPRRVSSYAEASGSATLIAAWSRTGASIGEMVASTTTMPTTPTPTFTPIQTQPTPTTTLTPTPVPTTAAIIAPPPPPSLAIGLPAGPQRKEPVVVSDTSITISGAGIPGHSVEVQVDGIVVGTAIVRTVASLQLKSATGVWEFTLPPLATGTREIVTTFIDEFGSRSAPSAPTILVVVDAAPLDFDGNGDTAIAAFRRFGSTMRFKTRAVSSSSWHTYEIAGRYPAPADYDNDGATDVAAVDLSGDRLEWNIRLSSTGTTSRQILGNLGETIISGCHFVPDAGSSLAVFNRYRRELIFRSFDSSAKRVVKLTQLGFGDLLGCGDTDGDGKDEILFRVRGPKQRTASVAAFDTSGTRKLFTGYNKFVRGFVVRRSGTQVPLMAVLGGSSSHGRQVKITTMAGSFAFPLFYISGSSTIGTGIFTHAENQQAPGLFWMDNRSRTIYRRLLLPNSETTRLFSLPDNYQLIRPQNITTTVASPKTAPGTKVSRSRKY